MMKADIAAGKKWRYSNSSSKQQSTIQKAQQKNKRYVNCALGCHWGLIHSGLVPVSGTGWWGVQGGKIQWKSQSAKKKAKEYLKVISVKNKTVKQCIKDGTLRSGDVVTYVSMTHTNVYLGQKDGKSQWFDSGHATCTASGELAPFRAAGWIIKKSYDNYKVGYILRLKETQKYVYRVRVGIYSVQANARAKVESMKTIGYGAFVEKQADGWHVFSGSYENKTKATEQVAALAKKKVPAVIVEKAV